ncbi:uracil-DNA glycosylase family protein [Chelativorans sp. M5D2P16]|uniref:uracil-DNA glycosylase family protein n=1 Tax=Chelativorans sp. M5D2P16 TaxID=3095678 RepID=UPI002ACA3C7E|nr:uracil-DNA glycosylase family protein [Chelativorans sp. M5D2P16]MDZ5697783.1 uracil-DNA glycosylase family protein [Chelativorans sp. M5D2P16]
MNDRLETLLRDIRACRLCLDQPRGKPLPHAPRPVVVASRAARILIAGQAPGTRVHASGLPFDDRSGDRLRAWMGVDRAQFYDPERFSIVPMGFCFPGYDEKGSDLPPRRECAPAWRARLMAEMPQIDLVLTIGQYAQAWHLGDLRRRTVTETVRDWRAILEASRHPRVLPLPHPSWRNTAWLKKNPWFEQELLPVLKEEVHIRIQGKSAG